MKLDGAVVRGRVVHVGSGPALVPLAAVRTALRRGQDRRPARAMGLDDDRDEVVVGLARVVRVGSRLAPRRSPAVVDRG